MLHSKSLIAFGMATSLLMVLSVSFILVLVPPWRGSHLLARRWQHELGSLPDEEVLPRLRQIAQLGRSGTDVIVEEMGNFPIRLPGPCHASPLFVPV